jgi:ABC-type transport system involved in cytochrome bd biosynthesis fused ATPase/permease subunit
MQGKLIFSILSGTVLLGVTAFADTKGQVLGAYFNVEQAIISADLSATKIAASDLAQKAQAANNETISKDANDLANAESLDQARQIFKGLSQATLNLIQGGGVSRSMDRSMSCGQCMQTQKSAEDSCMGQGMSGCGMMRNMCSGPGC